MAVKFTQLQCKEVICVADGRRLGFIEDVEVEMPEGRICALIVPGPSGVMISLPTRGMRLRVASY